MKNYVIRFPDTQDGIPVFRGKLGTPTRNLNSAIIYSSPEEASAVIAKLEHVLGVGNLMVQELEDIHEPIILPAFLPDVPEFAEGEYKPETAGEEGPDDHMGGHRILHRALDQLMSEFTLTTGLLPSHITVEGLATWSARQANGATEQGHV